MFFGGWKLGAAVAGAAGGGAIFTAIKRGGGFLDRNHE